MLYSSHTLMIAVYETIHNSIPVLYIPMFRFLLHQCDSCAALGTCDINRAAVQEGWMRPLRGLVMRALHGIVPRCDPHAMPG